MNKQEQINRFLDSLGDFVERYYSRAITEVSRHPEDDWIKVVIHGPQDTTIELWSEGAEVTVVFGESHWHINSYDEPCNMEDIFENTIDSGIYFGSRQHHIHAGVATGVSEERRAQTI
jgi:hypothetical protein